MIPVAQPWLPDRGKLDQYLDGIYERRWLTNNGPLVQELTRRLQAYLGVENLLLVSNGTLALQIAFRALGVQAPVNGQAAEAITTPFTFVATASALKWEGIRPVFVDIDPQHWCMNPAHIAAAITPATRAIVPVHVFGNACEVNAIQAIAQRYHLKVIYDAAHAFAVKYQGESLLRHGDAATLSFHATKLFHTGEGGAIIFRRAEDLARARDMINFGITAPDTVASLGINAKMNELQAAMGLCVLDEMEQNLAARAAVWQRYQKVLGSALTLQARPEALDYNYAYFPVLLPSEAKVLQVIAALKAQGVTLRRYFYPSLDTVACLDGQGSQPVSRDIASRIVCLPLYADLADTDQQRIIALIRAELAA